MNKYILFVKASYCKKALSLCISFEDLSTRRNIEQRGGSLCQYLATAQKNILQYVFITGKLGY
jgi:hypothetical protein